MTRRGPAGDPAAVRAAKTVIATAKDQADGYVATVKGTPSSSPPTRPTPRPTLARIPVREAGDQAKEH